MLLFGRAFFLRVRASMYVVVNHLSRAQHPHSSSQRKFALHKAAKQVRAYQNTAV